MNLLKTPLHIKYRKDIDGLRALAVMLVVAFHAFPEWFGGGFIGVDIFFVISGFLISKILIENLSNNNFSFSDFYLRRVRRTFPALILVLSFSLLFGWFFLFPDEYRLLGKHVFSSGIFIQNFNLLSELGYFDEAAKTKPLLHLWSLGIEEQFYLIWPLLLWLGHKLKITPLFLICAVGFISFILNLLTSPINPNLAFFSPLTRFWELLTGGFLACLVIKHQESSKGRFPLNLDCSLIGFVLIFAGVITITPNSIFPGWLAILPTLGAFLIIAAGEKGFINRHILAKRCLVYLGLISYPLYLWHWLLLTFVRMIESDEVSVPLRILIITISVLFSAFTYHFIEKPIQSKSHNKHKNCGLIAFMFLLIFIGHNFYKRDGLAFRMDPSKNSEKIFINPINDEHEKLQRGFIDGFSCSSFDDPCMPINTWKKKIIVWGDSHAQMLSYGLKENIPTGWSYLLITRPGCKPAIIDSKEQIHNECEKINYFATQQIEQVIPEIVLLAQRDEWKPENVDTLYKELKAMGVKKVLYLGKSPEWTAKLPKIVARRNWHGITKYSKAGLNFDALNLEDFAQKDFKESDEKIYISLINLFCNSDGCLVYLGDDITTGITSYDTNHLSPKASSFAIKELVIPHLR
jgi:peptidoglycan/LPS O-acetylase OafA/YrhL